MKTILAAVLVLGVCGTSVFAGEWKKDGSVLIGYGMPSGDVGKLVDGGVAVGLDYDGYKINDMFSVGAGFIYTSASKTNVIKYTISATGLSPFIKYSKEVDLAGKKFNAYGLFGLGVYSIGQKLEYPAGLTAYNVDTTDTKIGFNLGAGLMYPIADKMQLGLDLRYHVAASNLSYFIPAAKFTYSF